MRKILKGHGFLESMEANVYLDIGIELDLIRHVKIFEPICLVRVIRIRKVLQADSTKIGSRKKLLKLHIYHY